MGATPTGATPTGPTLDPLNILVNKFNIATHVALILFLFSSWINYLLYDTKSVMVFWQLLSKIKRFVTIFRISWNGPTLFNIPIGDFPPFPNINLGSHLWGVLATKKQKQKKKMELDRGQKSFWHIIKAYGILFPMSSVSHICRSLKNRETRKTKKSRPKADSLPQWLPVPFFHNKFPNMNSKHNQSWQNQQIHYFFLNINPICFVCFSLKAKHSDDGGHDAIDNLNSRAIQWKT